MIFLFDQYMIDSPFLLIHYPIHTDSSNKSLTIYPAQTALTLIIFINHNLLKYR